MSFVAVAFAISWALWAPLVWGSALEQEVAWALYYSGVIGPAAAAIVCSRAVSDSASLFRRVRRWRTSLVWYALAVLLPVAIRAAAVAAVLFYEGHGWEVVFRPANAIVLTAGLMFLLVPFEEIGWRGYVLPLLQRRHSALVASVIVGSIWAIWHLPLAWASVGYQRSEKPWSYMAWFFITILPVSCLATWVFNRTGESVLLVSLLHVAVNMADFVLVLPARTGEVVLFVTFIMTTTMVAVLYWNDRLGMRVRGLSLFGVRM